VYRTGYAAGRWVPRGEKKRKDGRRDRRLKANERQNRHQGGKVSGGAYVGRTKHRFEVTENRECIRTLQSTVTERLKKKEAAWRELFSPGGQNPEKFSGLVVNEVQDA